MAAISGFHSTDRKDACWNTFPEGREWRGRPEKASFLLVHSRF